MTETKDLQTLIQERFAKLPKVVQDAILSGNPEKRLRELSKEHQLHLDQWQSLENLVMLILLGVYHAEELESRIASDVGVAAEAAHALANDVTKVLFEPIREELERELGHPRAQEKVKTDVEKVREQVLSASPPRVPPSATVAQKPPSPVQPATPMSSPQLPAVKVERAPVSPTYKPKESSATRKDTDGDPYREPAA